jgi:H+-transporting ATPase
MSAFAMLLLVFITDFAKISLATDHVRPSQQPETWNIGRLIVVAAVLGALMVAESLLALWFGWSRFGLAGNDSALYTFSFLTLLYFAAFSIVSARERRWFWATMPSKLVVAAVVAETLVGTALMFVGLPGLTPMPWWEAFAIFGYAMVSCLVVNEAVKVALITWRIPSAAAKPPVDLTPQIAKRAYEMYEQRGRQDGRAAEDWEQAEREVRKDEPHKQTRTTRLAWPKE